MYITHLCSERTQKSAPFSASLASLVASASPEQSRTEGKSEPEASPASEYP